MNSLKLIDTFALKDLEKCHSYYSFRRLHTLLKAQKYQCKYCSAVVFEVGVYYNIKNHGFIVRFHTINSNGNFSYMTKDHVIPQSKGGRLKNNICISCEKCNVKKGNKILVSKNKVDK